MSLFLTNIILSETLGIERINEPVTVGIPFPKGMLKDCSVLSLRDPESGILPVQTQTLATWTDGSPKWVLLDFQVSVKRGTTKELELYEEEQGSIPEIPGAVVFEEKDGCLCIRTGVSSYFVNKKIFKPFDQVLVNGNDVLDGKESRIVLAIEDGTEYEPMIEKLFCETTGPMRTTLKAEGVFKSSDKKDFARFFSRMHFFANRSMVRVEFTIHNPRAAKHPGGLWDLGDPGSIFFKDLSLHLALKSGKTSSTGEIVLYEDEMSKPSAGSSQQLTADHSPPPVYVSPHTANEKPLTAYRSPLTIGEFPLTANRSPLTNLVIYQDSSGGKNWNSRNHVNRNGEVRNSFKGYRVYQDGKVISEGNRANPVISLEGSDKRISGAIQYFWQNFPKALEINGNSLIMRLFPKHYNDVFELQGGEQKTHTLYLDFGLQDKRELGLEWIQLPLISHASPEWYAQTNALPYLIPEKDDPNEKLVELIHSAIEGENSFFKRREIIDEYGWRHFGEFYADHEAVGHKGPDPLVSHYNNQYDCIGGSLTQFVRVGNPKWFVLADELARHVKDIDIYHTNQDRPGYNHGLFWITEHYLDAQTATHRCFSKNHAPHRNLASYGGGPALSHNYSSGMLLHYYLTGERSSMEAVLDLAVFIENNMAMENTLSNRLLQKVKRIKNYLENRSKKGEFVQIEKAYGLDGPGRASGNSLNTLLDAFILTKEDKYLEPAEELIEQCVSPEDDLPKMDLLDTENRWMYTVFLQALGKYLDVTGEALKRTHTWEYARKTLIHYAKWMTENEDLYLNKPEKLEFPNETWPAQDIRKCNILLFAAKYGREKVRTAFLEKAGFFFEEALRQFIKYDTTALTRPIVLMMLNGMTYSYWKSNFPKRLEDEKTIEKNEEKKIISFKRKINANNIGNRLVELCKMEKLFWKWHVLYKLKS